jgi:hypothetical protein
VADAAGRRATDASAGAVVTAWAYDAGGGAVPLGGASAVASEEGVARFTDLSVDGDASAIRLVFTSPALRASATSPAFAVAPGPTAALVVVREPLGVYLAQPFLVQPVLPPTPPFPVLTGQVSSVPSY